MELDERLEAPREIFVEVRPKIGREDDDPRKVLDALQQVGDLLIGGAIVGIASFGQGREGRFQIWNRPGRVWFQKWNPEAESMRSGLLF